MLGPTFQINTQHCAVVVDHGLSTQHFRRDKPLPKLFKKSDFITCFAYFVENSIDSNDSDSNWCRLNLTFPF